MTNGTHKGEKTQTQCIFAPNSLQTSKTINKILGNPIPFLMITLLDIEIQRFKSF